MKGCSWRSPVVRTSRVISWAHSHAGSVRQLFLSHQKGAGLGDIDCGDFDATNFAQLVAAVGPHLTEITILAASKSLWGLFSGRR